MSRNKIFKIFICIVSLFTVLISSIPSVASETEKTFKFICQSIYPPTSDPNDSKYLLINGWSKEIEKATNGRVIFEWHHASELVGQKQLFQAVETGAIDVGLSIIWYGTSVPEIDFAQLPFLFPNIDFALYLFRETEVGNLIEEALAERNIKAQTCIQFAAHGFNSNKEIRKFEDFKGSRVSPVVGFVLSELFQQLGMKPVSLSAPEIYNALQYNTIDTVYAPYYTAKTYRMAEVVKYMIRPEIISCIVFPDVFFNLDKWNKLPKDIKDTIERINTKYERDVLPKAVKAISEEGIKYGLDKGMEMIRLKRADYDRMWEIATTKAYRKFADQSPRCAKILEIALAEREQWLKANPNAWNDYLKTNVSD